MTAPIVFLTDFGLRDAYVGIVKGVIHGRNPAAAVIDLTHEVPPQDIRRAAFVLATSVAYFPVGSVFLVVVDPGVGTERRGVALEAAGWRFVGPDNGVFAWALRFLAREGRVTVVPEGARLRLGTGARAVELTERRFWRPDISSTFHGRDIFGPVAAELSRGRALAELGEPLDALVDLPWPEPARGADGAVEGEIVTVDGYGNLISNLRREDLPVDPVFSIAGRSWRGLARTFQSAAELVALIGSTGFLEVAAPNGSAARLLQCGPGTILRVWHG